MTMTVKISAFGDEVADDLAEQLNVLTREDIGYLELRAAWGKNVLDLTDDELARARVLLDARGIGVSAIGSPIGKSSLDLPREYELERLRRAVTVAHQWGIRLIRIFSFYVPQAEADSARAEVLARLQILVAEASRAGVVLVHENEKGIYGDTPTRCQDLLTSIDSPALRHAFDPANFVQVGVQPMRDAWPMLAAYTAHVHIKDARFGDGSVVPAGQGEGAIADLLAALAHANYQGFLTLEPHLQFAGPAGGYSGPEGLHVAAQSLRALLENLPLEPAGSDEPAP
jgi:sugar phosphate isomerase/epimerase